MCNLPPRISPAVSIVGIMESYFRGVRLYIVTIQMKQKNSYNVHTVCLTCKTPYHCLVLDRDVCIHMYDNLFLCALILYLAAFTTPLGDHFFEEKL